MSRLPHFDALYVFAVAARHMNFTAAAAELHRTQSAVSHRIKALEMELGVPLFTRLTRRLELTPAGRTLAERLNEAITDIVRTVAALDSGPLARRLRVTALPSVASRWLMPRLPRFFDLHPDVEVQVIADPQLLDLRAEGIDLAIRFGRGRYSGYSSTLLMRDRVLPVCSPKFAAEHENATTIDALLDLPLLHDSGADGDGSLSDWHSWLDQLGRRDAVRHAGQRFSNATLAIDAAVLGLGVALARLSLVADYLSSGILVSPLALATPTAFSYYLVAPPETVAAPKIARFSRWLRAEAMATVSAVSVTPIEPGFRGASRDNVAGRRSHR
jgi:LysR family transcriptional regulator, glycine cleavage system transcriptional activator